MPAVDPLLHLFATETSADLDLLVQGARISGRTITPEQWMEALREQLDHTQGRGAHVLARGLRHPDLSANGEREDLPARFKDAPLLFLRDATIRTEKDVVRKKWLAVRLDAVAAWSLAGVVEPPAGLLDGSGGPRGGASGLRLAAGPDQS